MKRMTLLARRDGLSTSDFRSHWAGPHAALALGMEGISQYTHNRVDKVLWSTQSPPTFTVDGIVELYFRDDAAMRQAQASPTGQRHIPADEPLFLKGWTLCIVETEGREPPARGARAKVVIPFLLGGQPRERFGRAFAQYADGAGLPFALNWTVSTARRERLWTEPQPPDGFAVLWLASVADAHDALVDESPLCRLLAAHAHAATAYLIDELVIR